MAIGGLDTPVEVADSNDNVYTFEVVGNKDDVADETAGEASLVGLARAIIARLVTFGAAALATSAQAIAIIARLADPPGADDAADVTPSDRIGFKSDTVAGTGLISLVKQALAALGIIDAFHDVPTQNSADNVVVSDVVGNKTDTIAGDSLYSQHLIGQAALAVVDAVQGDLVDVADETAATSTQVAMLRALLAKENGGVLATFPDAAAGAALAAGIANTYGALVAVSGALGADSRLGFLDFDTPAVAVEPCQWELSYAAGVSIVATGVIGFATAAGTYPPIDLSGKCGIIPAGATLQVRIRSATGGTTCNAHLSTMPAL